MGKLGDTVCEKGSHTKDPLPYPVPTLPFQTKIKRFLKAPAQLEVHTAGLTKRRHLRRMVDSCCANNSNCSKFIGNCCYAKKGIVHCIRLHFTH
jgi:hypothetical protein